MTEQFDVQRAMKWSQWPTGLRGPTIYRPESPGDVSFTKTQALDYLDRIRPDELTRSKWCLANKLTVIEAAALHNFLDPDRLAVAHMEQSSCTRKSEMFELLFALRKALKHVRGNPIDRLFHDLKVIVAGIEEGELESCGEGPDDWVQFVSWDDFVDFIMNKGLRAMPYERPAQTRAQWLHETATLKAFDEARALYRPRSEGGTYDPQDRSTWPDVVGFLTGIGMTETRAKQCASILRPDKQLRGGAPKLSDRKSRSQAEEGGGTAVRFRPTSKQTYA